MARRTISVMLATASSRMECAALATDHPIGLAMCMSIAATASSRENFTPLPSNVSWLSVPITAWASVTVGNCPLRE